MKQEITAPETTTKQILRQLIYYDIFDHLLSAQELIKDCALDQNSQLVFNKLVNEGIIFKWGNYYGIRDNSKLHEKRKKGEENTKKAMGRAIKMGKLISRFPYIRAVALSGSISKSYMDTFKDIDYFIITKPKRLWLARIWLVFYKKIFLLNSFRFFCLNYFIDENNLEMEDKNIFTATEINTLIPIYGSPLLNSFFKKNEWTKTYYSNFPRKEIPIENENPFPFFKRGTEILFNNFIGDWFDYLAMKINVQYWKWKYNGDKKYLFKSSFRFKRDEAKYHPGNFQEQILKTYREKIRSFENRTKVKLTDEQ